MSFPVEATLAASATAALLGVLSAPLISSPICAALVFGWIACIGVALTLAAPPVEPPPSEAEYEAHGLGPLPGGAPPAQLYLDLMKRIVLNLCYHEQSHQVVLSRSPDEGRPAPELARTFSLRARVMGEDVSLNTLSMVGLRRLDSLQACISALVAEGIEGDLLEAGCAKGGACIFMRAALRAHGDTKRRVYCCDAFAAPPPPPSPLRVALVRPWYVALGAVAYRLPLSSQRWLYGKLMPHQTAFPSNVGHASDDTVRSFMFYLTHGHHLRPPGLGACAGGTLPHVRSNFARLGLLDEQVVFLPGFFSETLPTAPFATLALLRLDGDLYPSTRDALTHCYPRLAVGGFCIVDDYYAFEECRRAVDDYRSEHGITDELVRIDRLSVLWRRCQ